MKELYDSAVKKHGLKKVIIVRRSSIYLWFKIIIPSIIWFSIIGTCFQYSTLIYIWWFNDWIMLIRLSIIVLLWFFWIFKVSHKLISYYMDFCIITPAHVLSYNQCGIFKRSSRSLDLSNLRSIDVDKNWLLNSLFNYGTVTFFSELDTIHHTIYDDDAGNEEIWSIKLKYIQYPRKVVDVITNIIKD